nr:malate synthase, glyoxysomal [Tanacetum cinerariifolium]
MIQETTENIILIKQRIQAAQDRQKSYADRKRKPMEFEVGDRVMLKVSPWKWVVRFIKRGKLNPRYIEPFKVLARVRDVAYRLELPRELSRVHHTFYVSNLKKCYVDEPLAMPLEGVHIDDTLQFVEEPVEIMKREIKRLKRSRIPLGSPDHSLFHRPDTFDAWPLLPNTPVGMKPLVLYWESGAESQVLGRTCASSGVSLSYWHPSDVRQDLIISTHGWYCREFRNHVKYAMECRKEAKMRYNSGALLGFDPATKNVRDGDWMCAEVPPAVVDRKVEITGPTGRKMVINALNSGAKVFMADFEDALSPTWENLMKGQVNLKDAVNGTISFEDKARNRVYKLNDQIAKLFVRPRGWHLPESHIYIDGEPAIGCLVDFGLYFHHNHAAFRKTQGQGFGPFFYLPKMENSREASIWNHVFTRAEKIVGIENGSIRATVLIETLPAAFQMDEILYELRDHSVGLNCGRWDYIFSYVKTFQGHPDRLLPDRVLVGMGQHFMRSYSDLLIRTCHRRGVHAMGGMAAQIPIRDDPEANNAALELVKKDKLREVRAGHDGTWAAHPGLIPAIMEVFTNNMNNSPNLIKTMKREDAANITEEDLLQIPRGVRTLEGLRLNTRVGIQYVAAWLTGTGSVPLYNLMEDAATAEISRVQNWQWLKYGVELDGDGLGVKVNRELFGKVVEEEMMRIEREVGRDKFKKGMYKEACKIFARQCTAPALDDFLTLNAYNHIVVHHPKGPSKL